MTVYADNAATTQMSENVLKAMMPLLTDIYGNPSSLHSIGQVAKEYLENARETVADCIGADPKEIYFTSGGSEADNQAIRSAAYIGARKGKKHIISSKFEHHAVLHTLDALKKEGFTVTLLDVYSNGVVKPEDVENAITDETCLVTMNVDMLSVSAHKFHGPKGVGFLYARKGILLTNIIYGGAQERSKRAGTENMASIVGMATAIKEATDHLEENAAKVTAMRNRLIDGLKGIERSRINGDLEHHLPGTLNMCFEGIEGESLLLLLDAKGICASSGSACTSGSLDPSHVLLSIGVPVEIAHGSLRLSISEYNTMEQMDHIVESVPVVVDYLRSISPVWEKIKKEENK